MAPKKANGKAFNGDNVKAADNKGKPTKKNESSDAGHGSKKRKAQDEPTKPVAKASRRSARGPAAQPADPVKLINFLLSNNALPFCRPKNETEDIESRGKQIRTYSLGDFTPFEELVCALILSRPIR